MQVEHPRDDPPDEIQVGGETYTVENGVVDLPGWREANTLARRFGVHPATIREDLCAETIASGPREGEICSADVPCPHHGGED